MSEDTTKLLERIAALESQLSPARKESGTPKFDKQRMTLDPIGYLREQGVDLEHVTRHFVAGALGKDCPPQLAAMVQMGPQIAATSRLEEMIASLSRRVEDLSNTHQVASLKTQPVDPAKYPTLAAAVKADPSILERELAKIGDVADPAKALAKVEETLAPLAKAFGFKPAEKVDDQESTTSPTSIQNPDGSYVKQEIKPASALAGEVPSLLGQNASGVLTADGQDRLKSAVLKKYNITENTKFAV